MISEIDLLRNDIPRLEKKFGVDNPFVEVLKAHLVALQTKQEQQRLRKHSHRGFLNFKRFQKQLSNEASNNRR